MGADHGFDRWDRYPEGRDLARSEQSIAGILVGFVIVGLSGALVGATVTLLILWAVT